MPQTAVETQVDYTLGPAMKILNPMQRAFVQAMLFIGGKPQYRAASMAGYQGNQNTLSVQATRMMHDERILNALKEEAKRRLQGTLILAVSELHAILEDPTTPKHIRLKAIGMVLDRAGLPGETVVTHKDDPESQREQIERIAAMARRLGLDPKTLLGTVGVTDAEFTEINPPDTGAMPIKWIPKHRQAVVSQERDISGLEDLL